jgi:ATP-dependent DNA helicase RecG
MIDGSVVEVLRRTDEKLSAHNRTAVDLTSDDRERRTSLYPMPALQQIVRNAIMHRSYEATNAPVRVTWYDDRIEITSPGGPFGAVTVDNFGQPEALRVLGFVQRFGVGIATARRELKANGNPPPAFEVNPSHVGVTLRAVP